MNRATKKMMKSPLAKAGILSIAGNDKAKQKSTEGVFAAGLDFAVSFYELGKQHKAQGREKQNFEQFVHFNKLDGLLIGVVKPGVTDARRKEMERDFFELLVYPAYSSGYDGELL